MVCGLARHICVDPVACDQVGGRKIFSRQARAIRSVNLKNIISDADFCAPTARRDGQCTDAINMGEIRQINAV